MLIFISYAHEDLNSFRIPEIADFLENQSDIEKVFYWERDNDSTQTIVEYIEQSILESDLVLAISSSYSVQSQAVKREIEFAIYKNKKIIPIFTEFEFVREILKPNRGIQYLEGDFSSFLNGFIKFIKGTEKQHATYDQTKVQYMLNYLKRKLFNLFDPDSEDIAYSFANTLSVQTQNYFGIIIQDVEYLEDQKVYFLEGRYFIIPNSKTLKVKGKQGKEITILTRNNLETLGEKIVIRQINGFLEDLIMYVKEKHDIELSIE